MTRYITAALLVAVAASAHAQSPDNEAPRIPKPVRIAQTPEPRAIDTNADLINAINNLSYKIDLMNAQPAAPQPVAIPNPMRTASAVTPSCGMETAAMAPGCDCCNEQLDGYSLAPSAFPNVAVRRPVVLVEPQVIEQQRQGCACSLFGSRQAAPATMVTTAPRQSCLQPRQQQVVAVAPQSTGCTDCGVQYVQAEQGYRWTTDLCDILRGRTTRQVGNATVEVRHGLFSTEVKVLP